MIDKVIRLTDATISEWEDPWGYAPSSAAEKISSSKTDWISSLTHTLKDWDYKANDIDTMSIGEIILGYANLGALIEAWMMFLLAVYDCDYSRNKHKRKNGKTINIKDMSLSDLTEYYAETVWQTNIVRIEESEYSKEQRKEYIKLLDWIKKIEQYRNAIHCFKDRKIGTQEELVEDIGRYYEFLTEIIDRLPESPESYRSCLSM